MSKKDDTLDFIKDIDDNRSKIKFHAIRLNDLLRDYAWEIMDEYDCRKLKESLFEYFRGYDEYPEIIVIRRKDQLSIKIKFDYGTLELSLGRGIPEIG